MSRPQVLLTRRIPSSVMARLSDVCDVDVHDAGGAIGREALLSRIRGKQALIAVLTDRVDAEVLDAGLPQLRIVANIAVGYDNIDVAAARARGVAVTNTPNVLTEATAELTWALILTATRRVSEGDRLVRADGWKGWALDFMLGTELRGKRLGIIGMGRIGAAVASRAPAFGMSVVYHSLEGRAPLLSGSPLPVPPMSAVSLDELLSTSDVVSIHVPLTSATRHLIGRQQFARMKRTAFLVNTARGPVVDEEALAWALSERLIAGAALDVYEREPVVFPALRAFENVVLAPHLGSATTETRTAMIDLAVSNVIAVLDGREAVTPVLG